MMLRKFKYIATLAFLILDCYVLSLNARLHIEREDQDSFDNPNCDSGATAAICSCNGTSNAYCVPNSNATTNCRKCRCSSTYRTFLTLDNENGRCVKDRHLLSTSAVFDQCYEFVESAILVTDTRNCPQQCQNEKEVAIPHKVGENSCFVVWKKLQYLNNDEWKQLHFRDEIFTINKRKTNRTFLQLNFTKTRDKWNGLIVKLQFFCASGESAPVNNTGIKCVVIKFKGTAVYPLICEYGWESYNGSCYKFERHSPLSWNAANRTCRKHGSHLVKIDNDNEQRFLTSKVRLFRSTQDYWIGLNDLEVAKRYVWESDNTPASFENWLNGEPNDDEERCVEMYHDADVGFWNDVRCHNAQLYICEKEVVIVTLETDPATVLENVNIANVSVKVTGPMKKSIRLIVHTFDVTAAFDDYIAKTETITLDSTTRQRPFIVTIKDDNIVENNEIFGVNITTADTHVNILDNTLFITIKDNDKLTLHIEEPSYNIQENSGKLTVTVIATGKTAVPISGSKFETDDGTAKEPLDYTRKEVNFVFYPEEVSKDVDIQIIDDILTEGAEKYFLRLTKTNNEQITLGTQSTSVVLIQDDDDDDGSCLSERTEDALGIFVWPETKVGKSATIPCPYNLNVSATRECRDKDKAFSVLWGPIDAKACPYQQRRSLTDLLEENVNSSNVIEVSKEIKNLSYSAKKLIPDDIANMASLLEKIVAVKEKADEVADNFFDTVDNILDAPVQVLLKGQQVTNSSLRIVDSLNTLLETLNITKTGHFRRTLKNFAVDLSIFRPSSNSTGVTFSAKIDKTSSSLTNHRIVKQLTNKEIMFPAISTAIHLPRSLFNEETSFSFSASQIVLVVFYKETKFFRVLSNASTNFNQRLNSYVIAGSIKGQTVSNLKTPIVLMFPILKSGDKDSALCGFWDFSQARWSREGCAFQRVLEDGRIVCHCDHLTNFAMLMDIDPNDETPHEEVLSLISYIGCAVSLVGLVLTIITILFFKDLRSKTPNRILLSFCIALSLTLIVFLCAAEQSKTSSVASCRVAAVALHYFVLVVFMWMAIQAFNMYLLFVKVMPSYFSKFMLKCCIVAWGIPAVIVSMTVGVAPGNYGDTKFCRLYGVPFFVSFLAPVLLILFGNSIAFVLVFRSLLSSGSKLLPNRRVSANQQLRQGVTISVLLGLTWMFGVFAVNDAKAVFQYLFCILNSLQGLFVFIFYCVLSLGTRKKYKYAVTKNTKNERKKRYLNEGDDSAGKRPDTATYSETGFMLHTLSVK